MKLSNQKYSNARKEIQISTTSMIDVVFLLLIFFLVTTTFIKPERQLASNILVEESDAGLQSSDFDSATVEIFSLGEQVMYKLGATQSNDLAKISKILNGLNNKSAGGFVRVNAGVPFDHAAKVIGAFKANGFENVSYLPAE